MKRRALIVGINDYTFGRLEACIPDANRIAAILGRDFDNSPNFHCRKMISSEEDIEIGTLSDAIEELFATDCEIALFYFSGHGSAQEQSNAACLVTQDARKRSEGVRMDFLLDQLRNSKARENIVILDCCFSGSAGISSFFIDAAIVPERTSILASSLASQVSYENGSGGVFTSIICDALEGGAADTTGLVTVASLYTYADKLLNPWYQRPMFKANVSTLTPIRRCRPSVSLEILRKITDYFSKAEDEYSLNPSYEPELDPKGHDNEKIFKVLQQYNRVGLLVPIDEEHMYWAAARSKSCHLTPLGQFYWRLVTEGML